MHNAGNDACYSFASVSRDDGRECVGVKEIGPIDEVSSPVAVVELLLHPQMTFQPYQLSQQEGNDDLFLGSGLVQLATYPHLQSTTLHSWTRLLMHGEGKATLSYGFQEMPSSNHVLKNFICEASRD